MKKLLTLLLLFSLVRVSAQGGYMKTFYDPANSYELSDSYACSDGTVLLTGTMIDANFVQYMFAAKMNTSGQFAWFKRLNYGQAPYSDFRPIKIRESVGGGCHLFGRMSSQNSFYNQYRFLTRIDPNGSVSWTKTYEVEPVDSVLSFGEYLPFSSIHQNAAGDFFIGVSLYDCMTVIKTDASGNYQWGKSFVGDTSNGKNPCMDFTLCQDGGLLLAGKRNNDRMLVKLDQSGQLLWTNIYSSGNYNRPYSIREAPDGSFYVAGLYSGSSLFLQQAGASLARLDAQGNLLWQKNYTSPALDTLNYEFMYFDQLQFMPNGHLLLSGAVMLENQLVVETDMNGNPVQGFALYPGMTAYAGQIPLSVSFTTDNHVLLGSGAFLNEANVQSNLIAKIPMDLSMNCARSDFAVQVFPPVNNITPVVSGTCSVYTTGSSSPYSVSSLNVNTVSLVDYCSVLSAADEGKTGGGLSLAPVPADAGGTMQVNFGHAFTGRLAVYDAQGRMLSDVNVTQSVSFPLQLPELPQGMYILRAQPDSGDPQAVRFIVR